MYFLPFSWSDWSEFIHFAFEIENFWLTFGIFIQWYHEFSIDIFHFSTHADKVSGSEVRKSLWSDFPFDLAEIWWATEGTFEFDFNDFYSFWDDLEKNVRFRRLSKSEISPEKLKSGRPVKLVSGFFTSTIGFSFVPSLEFSLIQVQIRRRQVTWLARSCGTPYLKTKKIMAGCIWTYLNLL